MSQERNYTYHIRIELEETAARDMDGESHQQLGMLLTHLADTARALPSFYPVDVEVGWEPPEHPPAGLEAVEDILR